LIISARRVLRCCHRIVSSRLISIRESGDASARIQTIQRAQLLGNNCVLTLPICVHAISLHASEPAQPPKRDGARCPSAYICPISNQITRNPVICTKHITFDWPSKVSGLCRTEPVIGAQLPHLSLVFKLALHKWVDHLIRDRLQCKIDSLDCAAELKAATEENATSVNICIHHAHETSSSSERMHFTRMRTNDIGLLTAALCQRKS
jgi:hypothetical protein